MIGSFSFDFSSVYAQLTSFAKLENFWSLFDTAFGSRYDFATAASFRSQWQGQNFSQLPTIEVISSEVLGNARGAYASSTNKIYLSDSFVATASLSDLGAVLLEEIGHFVDAQVNATDTAGDEGAIFAALVQNQNLDVATLQVLKAENDSATITLNGQLITLEQATDPGNTRANAYDFGALTYNTTPPLTYPALKKYSDNVGGSDSDDYFKFTIDKTLGIYANFSADSDATLEIQRSDGTLITSKTGSSAGQTTILQTLNTGTYYIHLLTGNTTVSNYNLNFFVGPSDNVGNDQQTAKDVGTLTATPVTNSDLVLSSYNDMPGENDYYKFTLTQSSTVDFNLTDGANSFTELYLYSSNSSSWLDYFSNQGDKTSASLQKTLGAGTYYVSVTGNAGRDYTNNLGIPASYTLSLSATSSTTDPIIILAVAPTSITEDGTTNLVYTFTRTGLTTNALTVNYGITGTADATDYTGATPGTGKSITFTANSATSILTIDPTTDTTIESNETVILTLASGTGYTIGTTTPITGTITNDDLPAITLAVSPANVTENAATNLVYTFTRTGPIANALTVTYGITGTADSFDYTGATPGTGKTITFAANSATATLTLDPTADTTVEPDETTILTLATGTGYTIGTSTPVTATITNDDVASYGNKLTTPIIRFQNTDKPGTYLFAGEQEAASIRQNYKGFKEEGLAFQVAVNKDDPLMQPFYRFQNTTKGREGTYLFADEKEAISIRQNYKNFKEEGLAFYTYSAGVGGGTTDFARFQNNNAPGTYLFTGPSETSSVLKNFPGFTLEGSAFAAG